MTIRNRNGGTHYSYAHHPRHDVPGKDLLKYNSYDVTEGESLEDNTRNDENATKTVIAMGSTHGLYKEELQ